MQITKIWVWLSNGKVLFSFLFKFCVLYANNFKMRFYLFFLKHDTTIKTSILVEMLHTIAFVIWYHLFVYYSHNPQQNYSTRDTKKKSLDSRLTLQNKCKKFTRTIQRQAALLRTLLTNYSKHKLILEQTTDLRICVKLQSKSAKRVF